MARAPAPPADFTPGLAEVNEFYSMAGVEKDFATYSPIKNLFGLLLALALAAGGATLMTPHQSAEWPRSVGLFGGDLLDDGRFARRWGRKLMKQSEIA